MLPTVLASAVWGPHFGQGLPHHYHQMLMGWSLAAPEYEPQMKYASTAVTGHKQMWSVSVIAVTRSILEFKQQQQQEA